MTNQEWLQQNNAKIEALQEKLANKVVAKGTIDITENGKHNVAGYSDANVNVPVPDLSNTTATADDVSVGKQFYNAQGELVEGSYVDMLQRRVDSSESCYYLFYQVQDEDMSWVKNLDTSKSKKMSYMFSNCKNATIIDVSNFNTSNVTTMEKMFQQCNNVLTLDVTNFDTSQVISMSAMFYDCKRLISLDVSNFNTSNVKSMGDMFMYCYVLTSVDVSNFDTSQVTDMNHMFYYCGKLKKLNLNKWDTSKVKYMNDMFDGDEELETILGTLDMISVTNASSIIRGCDKLKDITLKNIKISLQIGSGNGTSSSHYGYLLTLDTLLNTIKELHTNTSTSTLTLTIGTANQEKLANVYVKLIDITDEMRAEDPYIDNKAPFVQCESTDEGAMTLTEYAILKNWAIA